MATTLEERVARLEAKVARLAGEDEPTKKPAPWWKKIVGVYKDDPEFDEAERLGREYRETQRPQDDDPSRCVSLGAGIGWQGNSGAAQG